MKRPAAGRPFCCYCKRPLMPAGANENDAFTYDHVRAQSAGGLRRVPCCRKCNMLKGDTGTEEWFWFIKAFPRWWKLFASPQQVREQVRQEHVRRAWGNATLKGNPA